MKITFRTIEIEKHYSLCLDYRRDTYLASFGTLNGFEAFLNGYKDKMLERLSNSRWFYEHIWCDDTIIGQLEYRSFSNEPECGYIHLIYIEPASRGKGYADLAQKYIQSTLTRAGCTQVVLSVSRDNTRALAHYRKWDWHFVGTNPKQTNTDFYKRHLT